MTPSIFDFNSSDMMIVKNNLQSISHLLNSAVAPVQTVNPKEVLIWNYKDVLKFEKSDPESFKQWCDAMQDEIDALWSKQVWLIVDKTKDRTPIKCRWVYAVKSDDTI